MPERVTVIVDEAYIEFQLTEDPDATLPLLDQFPNLVLLRTFSKCYGLAGLRVGYGLGTARFRAAVDAVRQPFSVNAIAQAAAAEAILHQDHVVERVERTVVERVLVSEGLAELGFETPESATNFSWVPLGDRDEDELVTALAEQGIVVRAGTPLGGPGHAPRDLRHAAGQRAAAGRAVVARVARGRRRRSTTGWVGGRHSGERTFSTRHVSKTSLRALRRARSRQ